MPAGIEHAVMTSDVVVDGEVVEVRELEYANQFRITLLVTDRIKGEPPPRVTIEADVGARGERVMAQLRRGPFFLINPAPGVSVYSPRDPLDLLVGIRRTWVSTLNDLRPLNTAEEVRNAARAAASMTASRFVTLLASGSEWGWQVEAPVTDALADRAVGWAGHDDWFHRANAVSVLSLRPREEANGIFLKLLRDPYYVSHGARKSYERYYPVRDHARAALVMAGVFRDAVVHEPLEAYRTFNWIGVSSVVAAVAVLWLVAVQARHRLLRVRRCLPARVMFDGWLVLAVLLAVALVRSPFRADQIVFSVDGTRWEVISHHGTLRFVRFAGWKSSEPARFAAFPTGSDLDQTWDVRGYAQTSNDERFGVSFDRGFTAGVTGPAGRYVEWSSLAISYWVLLLLSLLLPVSSWLVGVIGWHLETRRRRCVQCGYDLRASAGGCPECGMEILGLRTRREVAALEAAQAQYRRDVEAYHRYEARMLELLAAGAVDEEGKPVARAEDDAAPRVDVETSAH